MKLEAIIEIPKGSNIKYEIEDGVVKVDRILYGANIYPMNYGFFANTLDWDGDPLDAMIIADQSFAPGSHVPVRVLGAMKMIDGGETDTKLITVIDVDPRFDHIQTLEDVPSHSLAELKDFFENYKNLQKKSVKINGFEGVEYAKSEYKETQELHRKYADMDSNDFIKKMMKLHPDKYEM